jgi:hypothetical protein
VKAKEVLKKTLFEVWAKKVMPLITRAMPFFGLPIINPVFNFLMRKILYIVWDKGELFITFQMIDKKVNGEVTDFTKAEKKFEENPEDKEAERELENAFSELVYLGD